MDQNVCDESITVVTTRDSCVTTEPTTTTMVKLLPEPESLHLIHPVSPTSQTRSPSPSPSKRMRYDLVLSSPALISLGKDCDVDKGTYLSRSFLIHRGFKRLDSVSSTDEEVARECDFELTSHRLKPVLPDRYTKQLKTSTVLVAKILDRTKSHIFLQAVSQTFKLPENLSHLKRVKCERHEKKGGGKEVILHLIIAEKASFLKSRGPDAETNISIEALFSECLSTLICNPAEDAIDLKPHLSSLGEPYTTNVAASAPLTRPQYEQARALWPCTFHEDKRVTSLLEGRFFTSKETNVIRANMARTLLVAEKTKTLYGVECDACMMVDPRDNTVVAIGHDLCPLKGSQRSDDAFRIRPYYHASMVGIDLVAVSQGGGAYDIPLDKFPLMFASASHVPSAPPASNLTEGGESNGVTYLGTGYDVYLSRECCLMCAMSLIHTRIRRLFFHRKSNDGALGSKFAIHTLESLNHHFEVFCFEPSPP